MARVRFATKKAAEASLNKVKGPNKGIQRKSALKSTSGKTTSIAPKKSSTTKSTATTSKPTAARAKSTDPPAKSTASTSRSAGPIAKSSARPKNSTTKSTTTKPRAKTTGLQHVRRLSVLSPLKVIKSPLKTSDSTVRDRRQQCIQRSKDIQQKEEELRQAKLALKRFKSNSMPKKRSNKKCRDEPMERLWGKDADENQLIMNHAFELVQTGMSIRAAAKETMIPFSTLTRRVRAGNSILPKMGRQYTLPLNVELQLAKFIRDSADLGYGLTVNKIRSLAYTMAVQCGTANKFNSDRELAGLIWWKNFKER